MVNFEHITADKIIKFITDCFIEFKTFDEIKYIGFTLIHDDSVMTNAQDLNKALQLLASNEFKEFIDASVTYFRAMHNENTDDCDMQYLEGVRKGVKYAIIRQYGCNTWTLAARVYENITHTDRKEL